MTNLPNPYIEKLNDFFKSRVEKIVEQRDEITLEVAPAHYLEVVAALREHADFAYEQLIDLCGVDYLSFGDVEWDTTDVSSQGFSRGVEGEGPGRFSWQNRPMHPRLEKRYAVVVHLTSVQHNRRIRVRSFTADNEVPQMDSIVSIYPVANWFEREAFDLYGIIFTGHPDLRRILTDYGFVGHPFRKDFPLIGNVEVLYDEEKKRIVYQPVSIEPRVGVPKVIRDDSRWQQAQSEQTQVQS
ncbi:MAG: NADH-quinone oxidoreductase subunit C [Arenimonas sp.]|nr:NADH-quinone oxidoreductase subunit C [Arenimonas sp.]